ncbi:MAG: hypothetical protein AAGE59_34460 [Cyanobacteria bacterium P01_F01_bin.86]
MAIALPLWIYWAFCLVATGLLLSNRMLSQSLLSPMASISRQGYFPTMLISWFVTLATAAIYILFTVKQVEGNYEVPDLLIFSGLNGTLEQCMFVLWFLVGCFVGQRLFPKSPWAIFGSGYISYVLYSGLIHPLFWFPVLPQHDPFWPMVFILPVMSIFWMWLYWRYQALLEIIAMHIVIDWLTVGHLHFPWFEPFQLASVVPSMS